MKYTKIDERESEWLILFEVQLTESNFKEACQTAIDLAKIESAAQNPVAINFFARGIEVRVTGKDVADVQFSLWKPVADAYNAIRNELAKSWLPQYIDAARRIAHEAKPSRLVVKRSFRPSSLLGLFCLHLLESSDALGG